MVTTAVPNKVKKTYGIYFYRFEGKKVRIAVEVSGTCTESKLSEAIYHWLTDEKTRVIKTVGMKKGKQAVESFLAKQVDYIEVREYNRTTPTDKKLLLSEEERKKILEYLKK